MSVQATATKVVKRLGSSIAVVVGPEVKQLGLDVGDSVRITIEPAEAEPIITVREHEALMSELEDRLGTFGTILHGTIFNAVNDVLRRMDGPMDLDGFSQAVIGRLDRFSQQVQTYDGELFWSEFGDVMDDMEIHQYLHRDNGNVHRGPAE